MLINAERMRANFDALAQIGATPDGGVHRPAFGEAHLAGRRWFRNQAAEAGLETRTDSAGNCSAILRCGPPDGKTLLLGSHLDSVVYGGRFDGALGVIAALEVLQTVQDHAMALPVHLEAIDFTDEEGYYIGFFGSLAAVGRLSAEHLARPDRDPAEFAEALRRGGLTHTGILSAARKQAEIAGYLELHIEQGARLLEAGAQIGVVTDIVGIRRHRLQFVGRADHSGTTPLDKRLDAALGACAFTLAAREIVLADFPGSVVNVGDMRFAPGASNIVPEAVTVTLEFRASDLPTLGRMQAALIGRAAAEAQRFGLTLRTEMFEDVAPVQTDARLQQTIAAACASLGLTHAPISSGAGHDAQSLAHICPVGMIFVPSVDGCSHSPRELTSWEDCANGANVLLRAALAAAGN